MALVVFIAEPFFAVRLSALFGKSLLDAQIADERRLLYQTEHVALSAACEELWLKREAVRKFGRVEGNRLSFEIRSTHPAVPPAIRALREKSVWVGVNPTAVTIEMGGGFCHYGFVWDHEASYKFGTSQSGQAMTRKQLTTNLWFYTEHPNLPQPQQP